MNKYHTLAIAQLIPHRPPMLLLDRIIEADFEHVIVETVIREGSTFYQSGCGVPALVGIEYMAQAAATLGGLQATQGGEIPMLGYLLGTRKYYCSLTWFKAGDVLRVFCKQKLRGDSRLSTFTCRIAICKSDIENVVAESDLKIYKSPAKTDE